MDGFILTDCDVTVHLPSDHVLDIRCDISRMLRISPGTLPSVSCHPEPCNPQVLVLRCDFSQAYLQGPTPTVSVAAPSHREPPSERPRTPEDSLTVVSANTTLAGLRVPCPVPPIRNLSPPCCTTPPPSPPSPGRSLPCGSTPPTTREPQSSLHPAPDRRLRSNTLRTSIPTPNAGGSNSLARKQQQHHRYRPRKSGKTLTTKEIKPLKDIALMFGDAIRQGGQTYFMNDAEATKIWNDNLQGLTPMQLQETLEGLAAVICCRGVVAKMIYSWCLIALKHQAAYLQCSDAVIDTIHDRRSLRSTKFGNLILSVINILSRDEKIGTDAYKVCPAIVCEMLRPSAKGMSTDSDQSEPNTSLQSRDITILTTRRLPQSLRWLREPSSMIKTGHGPGWRLRTTQLLKL